MFNLIDLESTNKFIESILDEKISGKLFNRVVNKRWKDKQFIEKYDYPNYLREKIWKLSFDKLITEHGRIEDQPMSVSQHLFGDKSSIAARVTFDQYKIDKINCIEYHTHPVSSLVVVLDGECTYSVVYESKYIINVALKPGFCIYFPANVTHTIQNIGKNGLETLNITGKINQPPYRNSCEITNQSLIEPSKNFSKVAKINNLREIDYNDFIKTDIKQ